MKAKINCTQWLEHVHGGKCIHLTAERGSLVVVAESDCRVCQIRTPIDASKPVILSRFAMSIPDDYNPTTSPDSPKRRGCCDRATNPQD